MNQRIQELERQATDYYSNGQERFFDRNKFAELMMQECISVIQNIKPQYGDYRDQIETAQSVYCIDQIKRHFGVEQ